ncbi:MAG: DUF4232 domain-containing protein [Streptosporangiaceae bacterium]
MSSALHTLRRPIAAVGLVAAVALVAACSASPSAATPPQPSGSPASSSNPPGSPPAASTAPATSPAATTPPAARGPQPCATRALQIKPGISQGAAGSAYRAIVFTNISGPTCTLYGFPGVSLAGGSPVSQIGLAAKENPQTPRQVVTLSPGGQASALLRIVDAQNFPHRRCGPAQATYLQVYLPNQTTPVYVAVKVAACTKPVPLLTVDAVKPGSGG